MRRVLSVQGAVDSSRGCVQLVRLILVVHADELFELARGVEEEKRIEQTHQSQHGTSAQILGSMCARGIRLQQRALNAQALPVQVI